MVLNNVKMEYQDWISNLYSSRGRPKLPTVLKDQSRTLFSNKGMIRVLRNFIKSFMAPQIDEFLKIYNTMGQVHFSWDATEKTTKGLRSPKSTLSIDVFP